EQRLRQLPAPPLQGRAESDGDRRPVGHILPDPVCRRLRRGRRRGTTRGDRQCVLRRHRRADANAPIHTRSGAGGAEGGGRRVSVRHSPSEIGPGNGPNLHNTGGMTKQLHKSMAGSLARTAALCAGFGAALALTAAASASRTTNPTFYVSFFA